MFGKSVSLRAGHAAPAAGPEAVAPAPATAAHLLHTATAVYWVVLLVGLAFAINVVADDELLSAHLGVG